MVMEREATREVDGSKVRLPLNVATGSIVFVPVGIKIEGKADLVRVPPPPKLGENEKEGEKEAEGEPVDVGLALNPVTPQALA